MCISQFLIFLATLLLYDLKIYMTKQLVKQEIMPRFFLFLRKIENNPKQLTTLLVKGDVPRENLK